MNKALRNLTSCGLLCLGWQLVAAPEVRAELLAFGPPPGSAAPPSNSSATTPPSAATPAPPPATATPGAPAPSPSVPGGYPPQGYPGYPPPSYPPGTYPPANSSPAPGYPPPSYPPGTYPPANSSPPPGYPPPSYPPGTYPPPGYPPPSYPPGTYPPSGSPPPYYPYQQPGYPPAYYQRAPLPRGEAIRLAPGAQTHDGFYLRMQLGLAAAELEGRVPGSTVTYGGAGASAGLAIGYSVAPHLTLYLDLLIAGASGTTPRVNGFAQTGTKRGANMFGVGPGLSFDFGPNLFAAATVLLAGVYVEDNNGSSVADSKSGAALELQFGKEWWASDNWGLGLSGQFIYGAMKGSDPDPTLLAVPDWRIVTGAILFSATYN